jgi:ribose transport system substrate-binding protein
MPPAVNAVLDGTMVATVRNPSCRIHGWAVAAGVAAVNGGEKAGEGNSELHPGRRSGHHQGNRAGHLWLQKNFLI